MTVPETMLAYNGTRHRVGRLVTPTRVGLQPYYLPACGTDSILTVNYQDRTHKRDCKRCFGDPTIPTFEAGELEQLRASLESVRGIAATLEAENAAMVEALTHIKRRIGDFPYGAIMAEVRRLAAAALPSPHGENNE